jgi:hypothetical protein
MEFYFSLFDVLLFYNHRLYFSYETLIKYLPQIKEQFQPVRPCQDIVTEISSGADGNLAKIMEGSIDAVDTVDTKSDTPQLKANEVKKKNSDISVSLRVCCVCSRTYILGKPQMPLMTCGKKCRMIFYYSRQC